MIQVDLITGFLGSGKTTFIKRYAKYLMDQGMRIGILENDFGAVNVDMLLLQDLSGEQCDLEMIAGGCDKDCHRRRFKTKLIAMGMAGYDRVLVEPSGIFDVDEFFDILYEEPLDRWYRAGNVIAIADAKLEEHLSEQAEFLLACEVACAGCVVLSKVQEAEKEQVLGIKNHLERALDSVQCKRRFQENEIIAKDWDTLTDEDFARIASCGWKPADYRKMDLDPKKTFSSLYFMNLKMSGEMLKEAVRAVFHDPACGNIFRIKGFLKEENEWLELNATAQNLSLTPIPVGQEVLIVIGEGLEREAISRYLGEPAC